LGTGLAAALLAPRSFGALPGGFAYHLDRAGNAISIRRASSSGEEIRRIASRSPAAVALHPNGRWMYVVNAVDEYEYLPRGTVESYELKDGGKDLRLVETTPLSLSGIFPSDIALSPDGHYAVVAVAGGGSYNVLPVAPDSGMLQQPIQIIKRCGVVPDRVAFAPSGRILYAGGGEIFHFNNGRIEILATTT
jgi:6-phosphogluconolactonase (cycloisomerase 2 family)